MAYNKVGSLIVKNGAPIRQSDIAMTAFNEVRFTERTNIFNLSSVIPLSILRDVQLGSGAVTHTGTEYQIEPGGILESAELGRYISGYQAEAGKGVRIDDTTDAARWGYYNEYNGVWWHYSQADNFSVGLRKDGEDSHVVPREKWNIDRLDGKGPSGINIAEKGTGGIVFQEVIGWYGYLPISWWIADYRSGILPQLWPVHVAGDFSTTSINNPNLPIRIENEGASGQVYAAGRQYSVIGKYTANERPTNAFASVEKSIGTEWQPLLSVRRRQDADFTAYSFSMRQFSGYVTGDGTGLLMMVLGGTLTNDDYNLSPLLRSMSETGAEFDESATAIEGAEAISDPVFINPTDSNQNNASGELASGEVNQRMPRDLPITLMGMRFSGTSLSIRPILGITEEL